MKFKKDKLAYLIILLSSFIIIGFIFWLVYFRESSPSYNSNLSYVPLANAIINTITICCLTLGYVFIKKRLVAYHKFFMILSAVLSAIFLINYLVYHYAHGDTKFTGQGNIRYVYFTILISHIILSVVQVPLILTTFYHAIKKNYLIHKKVAKITFPIWMYVCSTGVLVFIFLKTF